MPGPTFTSHASSDHETAREIRDLLERRGLATWLTLRDVPPGTSYGEEIVEAIRRFAAATGETGAAIPRRGDRTRSSPRRRC